MGRAAAHPAGYGGVMPTPHRLVVMRHAKSSWSAPEPDHLRPLKKRGKRDGLAAGQWLADHLGPLDRVLSSPSARTRQTWERARAGGATAGEVTFHDHLYGEGAGAFTRLLRKLPESTGTALVLGHWPDVEELTRSLAPRDGHPGWESMDRKFPTSAIAVLEIPVPWAELAPGVATLVDYVVPRG